MPPEIAAGLPPAIRITGSNGKGSTAALAASVLAELGLSVGMYTSPHFLSWNERFVVDGRPLPDDELEASARWFWEAAEGIGPAVEETFSAFEAATAVALRAFGRRRPDVLVVEAGIGGRLDPTRVFEGAVCGLASLDLEHTELLGESLEEIARDKAGLVPDGGVLVVGELGREAEGVSAALRGELEPRGARVVPVEEAATWSVGRVNRYGTQMDLKVGPVDRVGLRVGLHGEHQAANAALAAVLVREWLQRAGGERGRRLAADGEALGEALEAGLARARVSGRFEKVGERAPEVWVDVAHTPAATAALAETVEVVFETPPVLLVGVSEGRDPDALLTPLVRTAMAVVATRPAKRGAPARTIADAVSKLRPDLYVPAVEPVEAALREARDRAREQGTVVLVCGSFFLAAEVAGLADG